MATITRHAVTWTNAGTPASGTFLNGEPWVVGPVTLTSRSPAPTGTGVNTRNGGMVNPTAYQTQGFDGRIDISDAGAPGYDATLNAEASFPLVLSPGQTLCSAVSGNPGQTTAFSSYSGNPVMLTDMSYLTVLASAPASPSTTFRPAYAGTDKRLWTTADVNYGLLPNLTAPVDPIGSQSAFADYRLDFDGDFFTRFPFDLKLNCQPAHSCLSPRNNTVDGFDSSSLWYPSYTAWRVARLAMLAASNHSRRIDAANRLIQLGIDRYGVLVAAGTTGLFMNGAGFGAGYFFPILFAGKMLGYQPMLDILTAPWQSTGSKSYYTFGTPDFLGIQVGAFWETASLYYSTSIWSGFSLPKPTGAYGGKFPLYGDPRNSAGVSGNDTRRDPAMQADAIDQGSVAYGSYPLTTAAGWGSYMQVAGPPSAGMFAAAVLMGFKSSYPPAARDWFERWLSDEKLWKATALSNNAERDTLGFGGSGNQFMYQMWTTYKPAGVTYPSVTVTNPTLRVTA